MTGLHALAESINTITQAADLKGELHRVLHTYRIAIEL